MYKRASEKSIKTLRRRKPVASCNRFKKPPRKSFAMPLRQCSFCNTGHLSDGTIAFVGVIACPNCLRDETTADFRELLASQSAAYQQKFAGGIA